MAKLLNSGASSNLPSAIVRIQINGEDREFVLPSLSVRELIDELSLAPQRLAIEVNRQIVPRGVWEQTNLHDGDRVEIVHFVGGGVSGRPTNRGGR